jgi:hypothetical protein
VSDDDFGQAILALDVGVGDVGLSFLELGLAEFDDGAETDVVAGSREVKGQARTSSVGAIRPGIVAAPIRQQL